MKNEALKLSNLLVHKFGHDYYCDTVIIVSFSSFQPNCHYLQLAKAMKWYQK